MTPSFVLRCVVAGVFVFGFGRSGLLAQSKSEVFSELEIAMRQEIALESKDGDRAKGNAQRIIIVDQVRSCLERGETSQLEESLRQVLLAFSSDQVRLAVEKLRVAVQAERDLK